MMVKFHHPFLFCLFLSTYYLLLTLNSYPPDYKAKFWAILWVGE